MERPRLASLEGKEILRFFSLYFLFHGWSKIGNQGPYVPLIPMEPPCLGLFYTEWTTLPFTGSSLKSPKSPPWTCWSWKRFWTLANSETEGLELWQQLPGSGKHVNRLYLFCPWICLLITFDHFSSFLLSLFDFSQTVSVIIICFFNEREEIIVIFILKFNKKINICC